MKYKKMDLENNYKLKFPHIVSLLLVALVVVAVLHLTPNNSRSVVRLHPQEGQAGSQGCDFFSGKWVYDNISYPLYKEGQCSFMEDDFACQKHGRKDSKYQNWRWQPHRCDLPRFNGTLLLEKLRGKKLVFVGDSLNRNQWKSMLCLIESFLPSSSQKKVKLSGNMYYFHSIEYDALIEFYWAPLLVESNCDDIVKHRVWPRIVQIKSIENHGRHWIDADILVFNPFIWWRVDGPMTILWGSIDSSDAVRNDVEHKVVPYEIALRTWSNLLEFHINRTKTKLFYMSPTPYRDGGTFWGAHHGCYKKTEPIFDDTHDFAGAMETNMVSIIESTIDKLERRGLKIEYLNITGLSTYREDAHPSIHRTFWNMASEEKLKNFTKYADCLHWCLPGVPDVWNEILYAYVMRS